MAIRVSVAIMSFAEVRKQLGGVVPARLYLYR